MSTTILTDAQILNAVKISNGGEPMVAARAIEQAVLQSPEVQRLREDAGRWRIFQERWRTANVRYHKKTGLFQSATITIGTAVGAYKKALDGLADQIISDGRQP